ncbi:MAG TPA: uracil-DNA glycosylase [Amnibacterium sp.]|nr:uracil-DNA glycosylase [Amnibacterium sp.]
MSRLADLAATGSIDADWAEALAPAEPALVAAEAFAAADAAAGAVVLPAPDLVLRAFRIPFESVRVVIVGQDPYPTPGHPIGLAFAVERHVRPLPRSLVNIYRERFDDLGLPQAAHGDLGAWAEQGVLLLNRDLTVRAGAAGSHAGHGWETVTGRALAALGERGGPLVAILWGRRAQALGAAVLPHVARVESAHPSPLSARAGFFGSRPFSRTDALLGEQGAPPVDWRLP